MARGKVLSFDRVKGYGFVAPDSGGEDVFLHVNDLLVDKSLLAPGIHVEFRIDEGERGPKASAVTLAQGSPHASPDAGPQPRPGADVDGTCDVLSAAEFSLELTDALLTAEPTLTGHQILNLRARLIRLAQSHEWVEG